MPKTTPHSRLQKPAVRKILEAAESVFAEQGYAAARVDDVAERAGVAKSHLYYHFESKQQLLSDLMEWRVAQILAEKDELMSGVTTLDDATVERFLRQVILKVLPKYKNFIRVAMLESVARPETSETFLRGVQLVLADTAARFVALGYSFEPLEFTSATFYFALLPTIMHLAMGERWADVSGISSSENDERFLRLVTQLHGLYRQWLETNERV